VGFLSALSGNAGEIDPIEAELTLQGVLIPHETVEKAYQVGRDLFAFTERRLILVDKQGFSGFEDRIPLDSLSFDHPFCD
jgi:Bacterial PH domain